MHLQEENQVSGEGTEFVKAVHLCDVLWQRGGGDGAANQWWCRRLKICTQAGRGRTGGIKVALYSTSLSGWFDMFQFEKWLVELLLPILKKKLIIVDNLASHISPRQSVFTSTTHLPTYIL